MDEKSSFITIEENKRLSESKLWELQEKAYTQYGPEAWADKGVPFYITSSPYTAKKYASVVLGYVRDVIRNKQLHPEKPIYIFDLGAGSGRFGYLFVQFFLKAIRQLYGNKLQFKYVMTDLVQENIESWKKHELLQSFINEGVMDFALYKHDQSASLELAISGENLTKLVNPAVIIGNYFFDTIPQDFFRVKAGCLEEGRVSLQTENHEIAQDDPAIIEHLVSTCVYTPIIDPGSYYPNDPDLNAVLLDYMQNVDELPLPFPLGAFQSIKYFDKLAEGRLLVLVGDQGVATEGQMLELNEPRIDKHGTFSMPVSYHSIKKYFDMRGGVGYLTTFSDPTFVVLAGVLGGDHIYSRETAFAFEENIDRFEPKDYWHLIEASEEQMKEYSIEHILYLLKLGYWDPVNFHSFFLHIHGKIADAPSWIKSELPLIVDELYRQFFPISKEEVGFIINLGVVCFEVKDYAKALDYFERAHSFAGDDPLVYRNISACHAKMGNTLEAFRYLDIAKKLEENSSSESEM
ncbi:MAG: tetratricopeptide repeat protein [Chlamydiota bacterium]|nr:tetratricopeptide repeat protein [Chlamydiota bacterium]